MIETHFLPMDLYLCIFYIDACFKMEVGGGIQAMAML